MRYLFSITSVAVVAASAYAQEQSQPARTKVAFARFESLEGEWLGKSTKGWTDRITIKTIAGGSVVEQRSFDAHPGETMLTLK